MISYCRAQPGELEQFSLLDSRIMIFQPDLWVCFHIKHIPSVDSHLYLLWGVCLGGLSSSSSAIRKLSQASPCSPLHLPPALPELAGGLVASTSPATSQQPLSLSLVPGQAGHGGASLAQHFDLGLLVLNMLMD